LHVSHDEPVWASTDSVPFAKRLASADGRHGVACKLDGSVAHLRIGRRWDRP
jgi:hypothetical protein